MAEGIMTKPFQEGKSGVNIEREKHASIRGAILEVIRSQEGIDFKDLAPEADKYLSAAFDGSISWYVTNVKLDLEARGLIKYVPGVKPQRLQLVVSRMSGSTTCGEG